MNWLDRNLPFYTNFMRFQAAISIRFLSDFSEIDPDFDDPDACSAGNKVMRGRVHRVPRAQAGTIPSSCAR